MNVWRLISREIVHRKLGVALSLITATAAVACLIAVVALLGRYDAEVDRQGEMLKDDLRKITKGLGFNVLILPAEQELGDFYAEGYASKTMPEEYVNRLAENESITAIEHLLPSLEQRVTWPEQNRTIALVGIRGQVPFVNRDPKKPIQTPVEPGTMVLGHLLAKQTGYGVGDDVAFMGETFKVSEIYESRGTKDDITMWLSLSDTQRLLGMEGQINAIWALNCNCASPDMLLGVQQDVAKSLPDTQVKLLDHAVVRAQARNTATATAKANRDQFQSFAGLLGPMVVVIAAVIIGLLALANVRDRRAEIGILRAIGLRSAQILWVFLGKAMLVGLFAAVLGIAAGMLIATTWTLPEIEAQVTPPWVALGLALILTPLLCAAASWLPAVLAARNDPAAVLAEE